MAITTPPRFEERVHGPLLRGGDPPIPCRRAEVAEAVPARIGILEKGLAVGYTFASSKIDAEYMVIRMSKKYVLIFLFNEQCDKLILMLRKKAPYINSYNGIGGKIEEGEDAYSAAIRECREEINIDIKALKRLYTIIYPVDNSDKETIDLHIFYQFIQECELGSNDEGDYAWHPISFAVDFNNKKLAENVAIFVREILVKEGKL